MDKERKYITIKEYADLKGVSVSAVYKRLKTTLQPYLEEVEGQKMLKIQLLNDENIKASSTVEEPYSTNTPQPSSTVEEAKGSFLEKQIEIKDKQIEELQDQVKLLQESNKSKDDFIQEQAKKLTDLLEQSNILLQNNQMLLAKPEDKTASSEVVDVEAASVEVEKETKPEEKVGLLKRIFG